MRVDGHGNYTIVVSQAADWPKAAQQRCRAASWIPWGPQPDGVIIYRHMLPDPSFAEAIQNISRGQEAAQMGASYPTGRYFGSWRDAVKAVC